MKLKPFVAFKSKFIKPCSKILSSFLHNLDRHRRRSFSLKPSRFRRRHRRFRTKVVRFRKPFSLNSFRLPRYRPKARLRFRFRRRIPKSRLQLRLRRARHQRRAPAPNGERFGEKIAELMSVFRSTRRSKELEHVMELHSGSDTGTGNGNGSRNEPFPSPITPAFLSRDSVVTNAGSKESDDVDDDDDDDEDDDDVEEEEEEEVCRSFESYLAEIIVEDGKVKDLKDVEEFLFCWGSLTSPVFVDLVSRFYGEVCKELFEEEETTTSSD